MESFFTLNQLKILANIVLKYKLELFRLKFVMRKSGRSKKKLNVGEQPLIVHLLGDSIIQEIQHLIMF